jgi:ATP-dependent Zn protease
MFSILKTIVFWVFILLCLILIWGVVERSRNATSGAEISYSDLFTNVQSGQVLNAVIEGNELHGHLKASPSVVFHTTLPANHDDLVKAMQAAGVTFSVKEPPNNTARPLLINLCVIALLFLVVLPPFWKIFKKAGFPPILSVLILVPVVNLITIYVVGFSPWKTIPAQKS